MRYGLAALQDTKVAFQAQDVAGKEGTDTTVVTAAQLPPGRYRLRLAAFDAAGRTGTVELPVTVGLRAAGPLQFSDLIVGVSHQAFAPAVHTRAGQPLDTLLELYSADPALFGSVTVTCEVRKGGDPAVVASTVSALRQTELERRLLAQGQVTTAGWLPGEYTVSAVISVNGTPTGRVSRSIVVE